MNRFSNNFLELLPASLPLKRIPDWREGNISEAGDKAIVWGLSDGLVQGTMLLLDSLQKNPKTLTGKSFKTDNSNTYVKRRYASCPRDEHHP